jgi:hypothetical protein
LPFWGSADFLRVVATASALKGAPLWNFTSLRSFTVTEVLSGAISQEEARLGTALPSGVYSSRLS